MPTLNIPLIDGPTMEVEVNSPLFVLGVNGSGKSALLHCIAEKRPNVKLLAGGRQLWLTTPTLDKMVSNRQGMDKHIEGRNLKQQERTQDSVKDGFPGAALHQLADRENEMARRIMYSLRESGGQTNKVEELLEESPPFQRLNQLLSMAGFPFKLRIAERRAAIQAVRESDASTRYGINEMSDGERNAILTAAEVLSAEPGITFLIDEPERHLHPAVSVPFLSTLFAMREDCAFLVATNQLDLPLAVQGSKSLVVRSCRWVQGKPVEWDAVKIDSAEELPEDVKRAILGARKKALFVEGEVKKQSLDVPLYTALFPDSELSIIPAGSRKNVINAVDGLRNSEAHHDVKAFGLVDGDGRSDAGALAKRGIYALPCYSVESLYYCEDAIASVARLQAAALGYAADDMAAAAKDAAIDVLREEGLAERMAARICERQAEAQIEAQKPTWKSIRDNRGAPVEIRVEPDYEVELERYKRAAADGDIEGLVARYPLRESGAFGRIASELHFLAKEDYQRAVVTRARDCPDLAKSLKRRIEPLADAIQQNPA